jgi:hypothetical protein
VSLHLNE